MGYRKDIIIVAGSGRSGTTWLGNIIAGDDCRILFEPLDKRRVPELAALELRPYFRLEDSSNPWKEIIGKLLTGEISNDWIDMDRGRINPLCDSGRVVVKEIRGNAILPWLEKNFSCCIVFLIRHPCAVIASRMKLGWQTHVETYLSQPALMADYLAPFEGVMRGATTEVEKHAVMWCVENLIPLRQMRERNWIVCRYEDLASNPQQEAARILKLLGLDFTEGRRAALREHSRTCSARPAEAQADFLGEWQDQLSQPERAKVGAILERFGITLYDVNALVPR